LKPVLFGGRVDGCNTMFRNAKSIQYDKLRTLSVIATGEKWLSDFYFYHGHYCSKLSTVK
jgi:hypothetical protein